MRRRLHAVLAVGWAALAVVGCGGSPGSGSGGAAGRRTAQAQPGPCSTAARAELARAAGQPLAAVTGRSFTAPSGAASCRFAARRPGARPLGVVAGIDSAPQAYARLEREAEEYSQNVLWAHRGAGAYPRSVARLGMDAYWFPADRRVLTTDGKRLVEIIVSWPGASAGRQRELAEALARGYVAGS